MAQNYIRFPYIDSTINNPKYGKWIPILHFRLGYGPGPSGAGTRTPRNVEVTKKVDTMSPLLMSLNAKGRSAGEGALFIGGLVAGSSGSVLLMKNVYIDSVQHGGSTGGEEPSEVLQLSFENSQFMPLAQYLALKGFGAIVGLVSWFH